MCSAEIRRLARRTCKLRMSGSIRPWRSRRRKRRRKRVYTPRQRSDGRVLSFRIWRLVLFQRHVLELAGLEDFPAFLALHVLGVFVAGDDLHPGMLTLFPADCWRG